MARLLVCSVGGHLTQLRMLAPRLRPVDDDVTWVTFDSPHSRSLLAGERVVYVPYVGPRGVLPLAQGSPTAHRLLREGFTTVVSTGAAVATLYLPPARLYGASAHYVESATRVAGPSVTGRLLAPLPWVHKYTQSPVWAGGAWRFAGSVFEAFEPVAVTSATCRSELRRVVVTLGTMRDYSFRRAVEALVKAIPPHAEVLWQVGNTPVDGLPITPRQVVPLRELEQAMREADLVVAHAGTGSALTALECGKRPLLVPREHVHGEHVDDHQFQTAGFLAGRDLAEVRRVDDLDEAALHAAAGRAVRRTEDPPPVLLVGAGP